HYPSAAYADPEAALIAIFNDASMHCPTRRTARVAREHQTEPVFRYVYSHVVEQGDFHALGAGHGTEVPFVFGDLHTFSATDAERTFTGSMMDYWLRFAATGDPNGGDALRWPG